MFSSFPSHWWRKWEGGWISSLYFLDDTNIKLTDTLLGGSSPFQESVDMRSLRVNSPIRERKTTGESGGKEKWGKCLDSIGNWRCWEHFKRNTCFLTSCVFLFKGTRKLVPSLKCKRIADLSPQRFFSLLHNLALPQELSSTYFHAGTGHTGC